MIRYIFFASCVAIATPAWAADNAEAEGQTTSPTAPILDPEARAQTIRDIQEMKARIERMEQALGLPASAPAIQHTPAAQSAAKDHNLELYGFVQLDAIQDFNRVHPDWDATLRPSRVPTIEGQYGGDGQSVFSARQSRLGALATGNLLGRPYEAKFEFDLYGTGVDAGQTTMRVRHMYAKWGPFLAGQTNTLFMDGDIFPNVIDYWGPPGMAFVRTPQLRWTFLDRDGWTAAVALEHPSDDIDPGNIRLLDENVAANIQANEELPDLTAAIRYGGNWGHVRLAGILRKVGYDTRGTEDNEPDGNETGWGVDLTGSLKASLATLRLGVVYGRGIATYMNDGGMDLAPAISTETLPGNIIIIPRAEAVKLLGISAYADLQWTKQWSSAIGYSFTKVDNTNFQDPTAYENGQYASANLLWAPASNILTGGELLWGKRTDNDGNSGTDLRFQYSFKWAFSSKNLWGLID